MKILCLADDLTGALEAGAKFAAAGIPSLVSTSGDLCFDFVDAIVVDTETRHMSPDEAARETRLLTEFARDNRVDVIYKKTDSTLRGNIGPELIALANTWPGSRVVYAPAYPAMGRTVCSGQLLVYGVPVHKTAFGRDSLNPISESDVARAVGIQDQLDRIMIVDAQVECELERVVANYVAEESPKLLAGPAAVADALVHSLAMRASAPASTPKINSCLLVNGSNHPRSAEQVEHALQNGWETFDTCCDTFQPWAVLAHSVSATMTPIAYRSDLGNAANNVLSAFSYDAVMVFGGDTAFGVINALGCSVLTPLGEIVPGVPICRPLATSLPNDIWLISKAGGFGSVDAVTEIRGRLQGA